MQQTVLNNMGPGLVRERFKITYKDFTSAALTQLINLKSLPKSTAIFGALVLPRTAFAGGGIGSCTIKVGLAAGATDTIVDAFDIAAAVADTTLGTAGSNVGNLFPFMSTKAADTLTATITTTVANGNLMTAGEVDVDVFYWLTEDLTSAGPAGNNITGTGGL